MGKFRLRLKASNGEIIAIRMWSPVGVIAFP